MGGPTYREPGAIPGRPRRCNRVFFRKEVRPFREIVESIIPLPHCRHADEKAGWTELGSQKTYQRITCRPLRGQRTVHRSLLVLRERSSPPGAPLDIPVTATSLRVSFRSTAIRERCPFDQHLAEAIAGFFEPSVLTFIHELVSTPATAFAEARAKCKAAACSVSRGVFQLYQGCLHGFTSSEQSWQCAFSIVQGRFVLGRSFPACCRLRRCRSAGSGRYPLARLCRAEPYDGVAPDEQFTAYAGQINYWHLRRAGYEITTSCPEQPPPSAGRPTGRSPTAIGDSFGVLRSRQQRVLCGDDSPAIFTTHPTSMSIIARRANLENSTPPASTWRTPTAARSITGSSMSPGWTPVGGSDHQHPGFRSRRQSLTAPPPKTLIQCRLFAADAAISPDGDVYYATNSYGVSGTDDLYRWTAQRSPKSAACP